VSINQDDHFALLQEAQVRAAPWSMAAIGIGDHHIDPRIARGLDGLLRERLVGDTGVRLRLQRVLQVASQERPKA